MSKAEEAAKEFCSRWDNDQSPEASFKAGADFAIQQIISLIESRIAKILGDAQPAPVLRIELQELVDKIKE